MLRSGCEFRKLVPKRSLKRSIETESERNSVDHFRKGHSLEQWQTVTATTHKRLFFGSVLFLFQVCSATWLLKGSSCGSTYGEILLLLRQVRAKGVRVILCGHPALDEVAQELVTVHPDLFAGLFKKSAGDRLLEQHRKRQNWSRKQSGTSEQANTSNTGLFIQLIKAD